MKRLSKLTLLTCMVAAPFLSHASVHTFHPKVTASLGHGYHPKDPFDDKRNAGCFKWEEQRIDTINDGNPNANEVFFEVIEVKSRKQLYESMSLSASASARYTFVKANASFAKETSLKFDKKSFSYVITGRRNFNKDVISGEVKLTRKARKLLKKARKAGNPDLFYNVCGSELITARTKGTSISVVYNFSASSVEKARRIKAHIDAKFQSGSASFDLNQSIKTIDEDAKTQILAYQTGTEEAEPTLLELVNTKPGDLPSIRDIIKRSLAGITKDGSPILEIGTSSLSKKFPRVAEAFSGLQFSEAARINDQLIKLQDKLFKVDQKIQLLESLIERFNVNHFRSDADADMATEISSLNEIREQLVDHAFRCLKTDKYEECKGEIKPVEALSLDSYLKGYVNFLGWNTDTNSWWGGHVTWHATRSAWPLASFYNLENIEFIAFKAGNDTLKVFNRAELSTINDSGNNMKPYIHLSAGNPNTWCWEATPEAACHAGARAGATGAFNERYSGLKFVFEIHTKDGNIKVEEVVAPKY